MNEIKTRTFIRFSGRQNLELETADYRLFVEPYGPHHPKAVGRVYQVGSGTIEWGAETTLAYVKKILPNLPQESRFPIVVDSEKINEDEGIVTLSATIEYNRTSSRALPFKPEFDGNKITIELYVEDVISESIDKLRAATQHLR